MADAPFEVEIKSTGKVFTVPEGKSILNVLNENGVYVASSCEDGICGTCVTGVVSGEPEHRDEFLTDVERAANNQINVCISRSKSPKLVLDL